MSAAIKTWQDRVQQAHPRSEPSHWPDDLKEKYMAMEIADLRAALRAPVQAQGAALSEREQFVQTMKAVFGEDENFEQDEHGRYLNRAWQDAYVGWIHRAALAQAQQSDNALNARRYLALRNVPDEKLGAVGVPCISIPCGYERGAHANGVDADELADKAIAALNGSGK